MGIYAIKTTVGREEEVALLLEEVVKRKDFEIFSILVLPKVKGFVFVEASSLDEVFLAIRGIPYIKGVVRREIPFEEIENLIKEEEKEVEIEKGDIVEIISGPFKGEKAKIVRIDKSKMEVVVELLGAVVPLPVTLPISDVRLVEKAKTR